MSRDSLQTVTLPLLVDADTLDGAEGECAVFTSQGRMRLQKVRIIDPDGLVLWLGRDTRSGLARALRKQETLGRSGMLLSKYARCFQNHNSER